MWRKLGSVLLIGIMFMHACEAALIRQIASRTAIVSGGKIFPKQPIKHNGHLKYMKPPKAGDPYKTLHPGSVGVPKDINDRTSTDSSTGVIKGEKNSGAHETKIDANANSNAAKSSIITQGTQVTSMKTSTLSAEAVKPTVTTNGNSQPIQTTSNANAGTDKTTAPQAATGKTAPRVTLRRPHYDQNGKSSNQSPSGPQSGQNSKSPSING